MTPDAIAEAARQLVNARISGELIAELDPALQPATVAEAHAIQDATLERLGDTVAGWKVTATASGECVRGVLLGSRVFDSPARIRGALVPMRSVEVEIAFRFVRDLPAREQAYGDDEVTVAVAPFCALEVVDSRFRSYRDTPLLHRMADCVSNGAFVVGSGGDNWRDIDLSKLEVTLAADGKTLVNHVGGHPSVDPMRPAVALVNLLRSAGGVKAGQFVTTGTYSGLTRVGVHERIVGSFAGFGSAQLEFV
jgi:2-keto-4-pentenoate hydratase